MNEMIVSGISIEPIHDGFGQARPGMIFTPPPGSPDDWETTGWFPPGDWHLPLGGFLVRTADRVVLVDAGMGRLSLPGQVESGELPESLAAAGIGPGDVTDVVLTHLHLDHVGW